MKDNKMETNDTIKGVEAVLKGLIRGFGFYNVCCGLHNVCCHGEAIIEDADLSVTDKQLEKLFENGLEPLLQIAEEIDGNERR